LPNSNEFFDRSVFKKDDISDISSAGDFFREQPSMEFNDYNSPGTLVNMKINGTKPSHVLVRFDGVKLNDIFNGAFDFSIIEPEILSSISIDKVTLSSLYGGDSPGGVIDMKCSNKSPERFGLVFGSYGYKKSYFTQPLEKGYIFGSHKQYSGNRDFSNGRQNSIYILQKTDDLRISFYKSNENVGTPGSLSWPSIGDRYQKNIDILSINGEIGKNMEMKVGVLRNNLGYLDSSLERENDYKTDKRSLEMDYHPDEDIIIGIQHEDFDGKATIYSDNDWNTIWSAGDTKDQIDKRFHNNSIFGEAKAGKLYFSARHDAYSEFGSHNSFNTAFKNKGFLITYFRGYKLPTFNDLYWPKVGNSTLKREKNNGYRITQNISSWFSLSFYKNHFKNLIEWAQSATNSWIPQNIGRAEVKGEELKLKSRNLSLSWNWCKPIDLSNFDSLIYKQRMSGKLTYTHNGVELSYLYHGRMRIESDTNFTTGAKTIRYRPAVGTWNFSLNGKKIFLRIDNIFDKEYMTVKNYPYSERTFTIGIRYRF